MMRILKKHKVFLIVLLILLLAFGVYRVYSWIQGEPREDLLYTQEYISGTGNIKGDGDIEKWEALGEEFAIGANKDGYAVFKNPRKAMNAICSDFKAGIRAMQKEGAPMGFRSNYSSYIDYELAVSGDAETKRQANIVAGFVDIYENSFVPIEPE